MLTWNFVGGNTSILLYDWFCILFQLRKQAKRIKPKEAAIKHIQENADEDFSGLKKQFVSEYKGEAYEIYINNACNC